jgi:hypothetical protein
MVFKSKEQIEAEAKQSELVSDADDDMAMPPDAPPEKTYIVLHGLGRIARYQIHWVDNTRFQGGMALHVTQSVIDGWRSSPNGRTLKIKKMPDIANAEYDSKGNIPDEVYDKVCGLAGIVKESPVKTAAVLRTTDIDALVKELGEEGTAKLYEQLGQRVKRRARN